MASLPEKINNNNNVNSDNPESANFLKIKSRLKWQKKIIEEEKSLTAYYLISFSLTFFDIFYSLLEIWKG